MRGSNSPPDALLLIMISPSHLEMIKSIQKSAEKQLGIVPKQRGSSNSNDYRHFVTIHHSL